MYRFFLVTIMTIFSFCSLNAQSDASVSSEQAMSERDVERAEELRSISEDNEQSGEIKKSKETDFEIKSVKVSEEKEKSKFPEYEYSINKMSDNYFCYDLISQEKMLTRRFFNQCMRQDWENNKENVEKAILAEDFCRDRYVEGRGADQGKFQDCLNEKMNSPIVPESGGKPETTTPKVVPTEPSEANSESRVEQAPVANLGTENIEEELRIKYPQNIVQRYEFLNREGKFKEELEKIITTFIEKAQQLSSNLNDYKMMLTQKENFDATEVSQLEAQNQLVQVLLTDSKQVIEALAKGVLSPALIASSIEKSQNIDRKLQNFTQQFEAIKQKQLQKVAAASEKLAKEAKIYGVDIADIQDDYAQLKLRLEEARKALSDEAKWINASLKFLEKHESSPYFALSAEDPAHASARTAALNEANNIAQNIILYLLDALPPFIEQYNKMITEDIVEQIKTILKQYRDMAQEKIQFAHNSVYQDIKKYMELKESEFEEILKDSESEISKIEKKEGFPFKFASPKGQNYTLSYAAQKRIMANAQKFNSIYGDITDIFDKNEKINKIIDIFGKLFLAQKELENAKTEFSNLKSQVQQTSLDYLEEEITGIFNELTKYSIEENIIIGQIKDENLEYAKNKYLKSIEQAREEVKKNQENTADQSIDFLKTLITEPSSGYHALLQKVKVRADQNYQRVLDNPLNVLRSSESTFDSYFLKIKEGLDKGDSKGTVTGIVGEAERQMRELFKEQKQKIQKFRLHVMKLRERIKKDFQSFTDKTIAAEKLTYTILKNEILSIQARINGALDQLAKNSSEPLVTKHVPRPGLGVLFKKPEKSINQVTLGK